MTIRTSLLALLLPLLLACGDNIPPIETVADHVAADSRFSSLEDSLRDAGLLDTLDGPGPFTLFAYQDGDFDPDALTPESMEQLLRYHIHEGELTREEIERRTAASTMEGGEIHLRNGLKGMLLNDGVEVVSEPIIAENGIIHVLDRPLSRTLTTSTRTIERSPGVLVEGFTSDPMFVEDAGYIHDLQVFVELENLDTSFFRIGLVNAESGESLTLVTAFSQEEEKITGNLNLKLADGAEHDILYDAVRDEGGMTFPEEAYRPYDSLERFTGQELGGAWELRVLAFGDEAGETRLTRWGMTVTYGDEPPAEAIVFSPRLTFQSVLPRGFTEATSVIAYRAGGLEGEIEVNGSAGDLVADPSTISAEGAVASLVFPVPAEEELGGRQLSISAQSGDVSRLFTYAVRVVEPQAKGIDLLAHIPLPLLGATGGEGSDIWGWTDPMTGAEIAIVGTSINTAFVDISEPKSPILIGILPTETYSSTWRDIKVYQDHAFIVSEAEDHGMQIFDLTLLRGVAEPQVFTATAHNAEFGNAHNIAINEESATAYVVGSELCNGGMVLFDISTPLTPLGIGCFSGAVTNNQPMGPAYPTDVYTHDVQCVIYQGSDQDYQGKEICFSSDEKSIGIADLSDPENPAQIVRSTYESVGYSHQGWLTEDHQFFITNDEFDELDLGVQTRSYVWDVRDLDNPILAGTIDNPSNAVGHNAYIRGDVLYQANYSSGLRLVDVSDIANGVSPELAYYDTYPDDDEICESESDCGIAGYDGAWSVYPFFASGTLVVSDTERGLFVLKRD